MKWTVEILKTVQDPKSFKFSSEVVGTASFDERGRSISANAPMLKAMDLRLIGKWLRQGLTEGITATVGYTWRIKSEEQAFAESARQIIEAETPKKALRLARKQLVAGEYDLTIGDEVTAATIDKTGALVRIDGFEELVGAIVGHFETGHIAFSLDDLSMCYDRYTDAIAKAILDGHLHGEVTGIAGPRRWTLSPVEQLSDEEEEA